MAKKKQAAADQKPEGAFRDRIKEMRKVRSADLIANPLNWRTHGKEQTAAMQGILREIGWVDALLVRESDEHPGCFDIIDGHLRAGQDPDGEVPVLVLDVTAEEAQKILLTFDPIGAMAGADATNLDLLLSGVQFSEESLRDLVQSMRPLPEPEESPAYTRKISVPIYSPRGIAPAFGDIVDRSKADELIREIMAVDLADEERKLLLAAAERHVVFNFEAMADFYANANPEVQRLMERSACVLIDFGAAIENGYVELGCELAELYGREYPVNGD